VQVSTSKSHGGDGFLLWNARNDYSRPLEAMPEMRHGDRYFKGEEVKGAVARLAAEAKAPTTPGQQQPVLR
jgi:cytochrome c556